jgi:hypothetical protein
MAITTKIKKLTTKNGKTKYQAQVWHQGVFYCAKTFDLERLAREFKEQALRQIIRGELKPASQRAEDRRADAALDLPMSHWAEAYAQEVVHSAGRLNEYRLVGTLLADQCLRNFSGKAGAQAIANLGRSWRDQRLPRGKNTALTAGRKPKPLSDQTIRLRLTALLRLLRFAASKLPANASFELPALDQLFEFKLPRAHAKPRDREPTDVEMSRLLRQLGPDSEMGTFVRIIDDTGCRLSEVRMALGEDVHFFEVQGQVIGGYLHLERHKTAEKVGDRNVPLSLFAAQLLQDRKRRFGQGRLFPELTSNDKVCKVIDQACNAQGIHDLLLKDVRRAFINRNKYCVAHVDMMRIVGQSSLLNGRQVSPSEKLVLEAVGHTSITTTSGYAQPHLQELAGVFSGTSRWSRIRSLIDVDPSTPTDATGSNTTAEDVGALQTELANVLARLSRAGIATQN